MPTDPQSMSFAIVQGKRQADCTCGTTEPDCNLNMVGGLRDEHDCIGSAGYQWCEGLSKCIRPWDTECPAVAAPSCDECMNRQRQGENIACTMC